jgi:hypothetical protein
LCCTWSSNDEQQGSVSKRFGWGKVGYFIVRNDSNIIDDTIWSWWQPSQVQISLSVNNLLGLERSVHGVWCPDGLTFFCTSYLIKDSVWTKTLYRPDGCNCLPIFVFWKKIFLLVEHWKASGRFKTSGRMQSFWT